MKHPTEPKVPHELCHTDMIYDWVRFVKMDTQSADTVDVMQPCAMKRLIVCIQSADMVNASV